jgi:hypothetical protein
VTGVLPAAATDERPRAPPEPRALEAVDPAAVVEDACRVDAYALDGGSTVRQTLCVER